MFTWLFGKMNLPKWARFLILGFIGAALLTAIFLFAFPWIDSLFQDPTLG